MLADDVGWNDFGYQSTDLGGESLPYGGATPTLDRLARAGVRLSNFYAMPDCTPSRAALLTGVHPIHTGLYHMSIATTMPFGLPLRFATLPQYLKEAVEIYCREFNKQPGNLGARMSPSGLGRAIITDWLKKQGVQDI